MRTKRVATVEFNLFEFNFSFRWFFFFNLHRRVLVEVVADGFRWTEKIFTNIQTNYLIKRMRHAMLWKQRVDTWAWGSGRPTWYTCARWKPYTLARPASPRWRRRLKTAENSLRTNSHDSAGKKVAQSGPPRLTLRAAASTRVVTRELLEYSLHSISGCKFSFRVAVFLQSFDELLEFYGNLGPRDFICNLQSR